ncbi:MAG TPA: hypothetical protein VGF84_07195 [Micromonosporaceae bacterium]|jgi:hypothetical protein
MTDRRVLYVLALFEAGMVLLAMVGGAIFMGGALWYIGCGLAVAATYVVAGQAAANGRRWGLVTLLVAELLRLTGFLLSLVIGLLPWVDPTLTGASLADSLILPVIVAAMALRLLITAPPVPVPPVPVPPIAVLPATLPLPTEQVVA